MKRILVGVDGSKEARDAVKLAEEIARATECQLIVACAVSPVDPIQTAPELLAQAAKWQRQEHEQAKATVKEIAASIGPGLSVETMVLDGAAAPALSELAHRAEVDMVVVGHRGRNAVARALLGSVVDRLLQISSKPVLVAR